MKKEETKEKKQKKKKKAEKAYAYRMLLSLRRR